jgi:DNA repair exonuclease SbcCD ATPase subunit
MTIHQLIFAVITATISLGSVFIAIGVFKGRINQNTETNKAQDEQIKTLASKDELAAAIKRSDEMLTIMTKRAEEDRQKGQGQWREFHEIIAKHSEKIGILENQQSLLMKSLDEIKGDIKSGFRQLQDELKELRKLG